MTDIPEGSSELDNSLRSVASHAKAAGLAGALGLVLGLPVTRSRYVNGELVECSHFDAVKLAIGAMAIVLGLVTLVRRDEYSTRLEIALGVAAIPLGMWAVLYGVGVVGQPCTSWRPF